MGLLGSHNLNNSKDLPITRMLAPITTFLPATFDVANAPPSSQHSSAAPEVDSSYRFSKCLDLSDIQTSVLVIGLNLIAIFCTIMVTMDIDWSSFEEAACLSKGKGCFCETVSPEGTTIRQPIGAWSNLAFIIVGLGVVVHASGIPSESSVHPMTRSLGVVFGALQIAIGIFSFLFHASFTLVFSFLDVAIAYTAAAWILTYTLYRLFKLSNRIAVFLYMVLLACTLPFWTAYLHLAMMVLSIFLESFYLVFRLRKNPSTPKAMFYLYPAVIVLFYGAAFMADLAIFGVDCDPDSWFQFHGLWHVLLAMDFAVLYIYYVLENRISQDDTSEDSCEEAMEKSGHTENTVDSSTNKDLESGRTENTLSNSANGDLDVQKAIRTF